MKNTILLAILLANVSCGSNDKKSTNVEGSGAKAKHQSFTSIEESEGFQECKQILEQSLFNEVKQGNSLEARDITDIEFFSQTEEEAWEQYKQWEKNNASGGGNGSIEIPDWIKIGGGGNNNKSFDRGQFNELFRKSKSTFKSRLKTDFYKSATSNFSSYVRDAESVKAWQHCVTRPRGNSPTLLCYGMRDATNNTYVRVIYNGGIATGSNPRAQIQFPTPGVQVDDPNHLNLGSGTGWAFVVKPQNGNDGFDVLVNAKLPDGNTTLGGCIATIPPKRIATDACEAQRIRALAAGWIDEEEYHLLKGSKHPNMDPIETWIPIHERDNRSSYHSCRDYLEDYQR
jgi:hypothetical protein